ncbi:hypothetical protein ACE193_09870 [Bernardetia sp. OM2101]|uniref:hypothetical protein n=1 Tax=Bernardetia sp. OM2101 TaxID=3344876 RepID=UPI0035CF0746
MVSCDTALTPTEISSGKWNNELVYIEGIIIPNEEGHYDIDRLKLMHENGIKYPTIEVLFFKNEITPKNIWLKAIEDNLHFVDKNKQVISAGDKVRVQVCICSLNEKEPYELFINEFEKLN